MAAITPLAAPAQVGSTLTPEQIAHSRKSAQDFEAMAIGQMLQPMFKTIDTSKGLFGGGQGEKTWQPMLVDEMGKMLAKSGGIGIADAVFREMLRLQERKMADTLAMLTSQLNDVIAEETALLDALDLRAAGALLTRKRDAVLALQNALSAASAAAELAGEHADQFRANAHRLAALSEANRLAVERGLALQMRLIRAIAMAVPRARANDAPIYRPDGTQLPPQPPEAYAFLSRM